MLDITDPQYKTPDGSALRIWRDAAKNNFLSEKSGRAIFDEVTYVEVISPGSRDSTPVFEVRRKFADEMGTTDPLYGTKWDTFKEYVTAFDKAEDDDTSLSGTPLAQWPEMTRTMVAALKSQSIFTVDALANLPDTRLLSVGPDGRTWREKAKAFLDSAANGAVATALAAENERLKADMTAQADQIAQLAATVAALQAAQAGNSGAPAPDAEAGSKTAQRAAQKAADQKAADEAAAAAAAAAGAGQTGSTSGLPADII